MDYLLFTQNLNKVMLLNKLQLDRATVSFCKALNCVGFLSREEILPSCLTKEQYAILISFSLNYLHELSKNIKECKTKSTIPNLVIKKTPNISAIKNKFNSVKHSLRSRQIYVHSRVVPFQMNEST